MSNDSHVWKFAERDCLNGDWDAPSCPEQYCNRGGMKLIREKKYFQNCLKSSNYISFQHLSKVQIYRKLSQSPHERGIFSTDPSLHWWMNITLTLKISSKLRLKRQIQKMDATSLQLKDEWKMPNASPNIFFHSLLWFCVSPVVTNPFLLILCKISPCHEHSFRSLRQLPL